VEYKYFAKYYDEFYSNKDYAKEAEFLKKIIGNRHTILDVGCGTAIHMSLLEKNNYEVEGMDLNKEMLDISRTRVKGKLYNGDMLDFSLNKKYDVIICMFAVINHLKNEAQLGKALSNFTTHLNSDGLIVIDLHNPESSGSKTDSTGNIQRIMTWTVDKEREVENSNINFIVNDKVFNTSHQFRIFSIEEVVEIANGLGLTCVAKYENYSLKAANNSLKNIQLIFEYNKQYHLHMLNSVI